jgi:hypothetical protein
LCKKAPEKGRKSRGKSAARRGKFESNRRSYVRFIGTIMLNDLFTRTIVSIAAASGRSDGGSRARGE